MEWYYWVNGKWITTKELSSLIDVGRIKILNMYNNKQFEILKSKLGYVPIRGIKTYLRLDPALRGKPVKRWWFVFKINNRYKYGMCFGRGRILEEALNDIKFSRRNSEYTHEIIFHSTDYKKAQAFLMEKIKKYCLVPKKEMRKLGNTQYRLDV